MIVYHHLGLGDHIICNGLVRHLYETNKDLKIFCKKQNIKNITFMYRDTSIQIIPIENDQEANLFCNNNNCFRIGFAVGGQSYPDKLWDETFYLNANIPFEYSWSKFYYEQNKDEESKIFDQIVTDNNYIFIHNTDSYGVNRINKNFISSNYYPIISDKNIPFFAYRKIIEHAKEIHCIDSSFKHLIDRIPTSGLLYYHKLNNRKTFDTYHSKKEWIIV